MILTINLLFSTLVFAIIAALYVLPKLPKLEPKSVVLPILLLHAFRHLGLMFLAPGATYPGIPAPFAYSAAFGDLVAAVLALIAIVGILRMSRFARPLVALFNVRERLTSWRPSFSAQSMMRHPTWARRIGYRHSGFRLCW